MSLFNRETKAEKIVRKNRKALTAKEANIMMSEMLLALADELAHDHCEVCSETGSKTEVRIYAHIVSELREKGKALVTKPTK